MMAKSVGEQLKQARLERGITLDQASKVTRIRVAYLEALENNQREALPSTVQGKGFMRLFADYLNLPVQPLLLLWDGKEPASLPEVSIMMPPDIEPEPAPETLPQDDIPGSSEEDANTVTFLPSTVTGESMPVETEDSSGGSKAIFLEIGQKLRKQRETLGLSLVEVERYTHLRQHYIQAMEEGNQAGLPSPVQGRGMLSNYAAFLNLGEDDLLLRYAEALQARRSERMPKSNPQPLFTSKKRPARQAPFWRRFLTPDLLFGVGLAAAILFFVIWTASRISALRSEGDEPTPPAIAEILLNPDGKEITGTPPAVQTEGLPGLEITGEVASIGTTNEEAGSDPGSSQPAPLDTAVPTNTAVPLSVAPINDDPFQVYIIAHQRAWLRVITDGKIAFLGRVVPGNAYAYSADKQIELTTGNAGALQVFYNQTDLGTLGITGEVVGLIFNQEGMMTPTAAFTATPTETPIATVTPQPSATPQATPTVTPFVP